MNVNTRIRIPQISVKPHAPEPKQRRCPKCKQQVAVRDGLFVSHVGRSGHFCDYAGQSA